MVFVFDRRVAAFSELSGLRESRLVGLEKCLPSKRAMKWLKIIQYGLGSGKRVSSISVKITLKVGGRVVKIGVDLKLMKMVNNPEIFMYFETLSSNLTSFYIYLTPMYPRTK